jgi:putative two-component system response regulator
VLVTGLDQFEHRIRGVEAGADDFITKPVHPAEITARVKNLLKIKEMHNELLLFQKKLREQNLILEDMVKERTKALELALKELLESHEKLVNTQKNTLIKLSLAAEYKDRATANHIQRIGYYSKAIASALGWSEEMQEIINLASQMHDVGKIGIPDSILTKSRKLTPHELAKMREHTFIGSKLLSGTDSQLLKMAEEIAMSHHEQWDGKGYPRGLKGKEIPLSGRISAVADVFDALISARCYKKAWEIEKVFRTIKKCAGTRFDPEVVDAFFRVKDKLIEIVRKCREN